MASKDALKWHRTVALAFAAVFIMYALYSIARNYIDPPGVDFVSFWAAARLAVAGTPELAYNVTVHGAMEATAGRGGNLLPFTYPPPFLLLMMPFGALSFWLALVLWITATAIFYVIAVRRIAPLPYSLGHPATLPNALIGQTGLFITGIFVTGLRRRSFLSGMILGLLIIKPQLAALLPVALVAGRQWATLAGAAVSSLGLLLLALLAFGADTYSAFFRMIPYQAGLIIDGRVPWNELASTFALLRWSGIPFREALTIHALIAAAAIVETWRSWWRNDGHRDAILAAATVLVAPYLFTYDTLLLIVPLGLLVHQKRAYSSAAVWLCCLPAVVSYSGWNFIPNTTPLAAIIALLAITWRRGDSMKKVLDPFSQ